MKNEITTDSSRLHKHWPLAILGLLALAGIMFFFGLGSLPLVGPDEPRYAEVGREMFASGDYISPRLSGYLWFEKPVLLYWLSAVSYSLFGVHEWGARFASAFTALLTVCFIVYALRRLISARLAFFSGVVLTTMALWFAFARAASTDMVLAWSISIAVMSGYLSLMASGKARWNFWLLCCFATGLAMLAKGLIGILLVVGILGLFAISTRRLSLRALLRHWPHALFGILLFSVVVSLWYVPVTLRHGSVFINEFFVNHHFKRFLTNEYHHKQPIYFYLLILIAGTIPWPFFLMPALARLPSLRPRDNEIDSVLLLAWIWVAVPLIFFSLSTSKLPSYILPIFPPLAIIIGAEVERVWGGVGNRWHRAAMILSAMLLIVASGAFVFYLHKKIPSQSTLTLIAALIPSAMALVAALILATRRIRPFLAAIPVVTAGVIIAAVLLLFPGEGPRHSLKALSQQINSNIRPAEKIVFYRKDRHYAPLFYNRGRFIFFKKGQPLRGLASGDDMDAKTPADLELALEQSNSSLIVITDAVSQIELERSFNVQAIGHQEDTLALRVTLRS